MCDARMTLYWKWQTDYNNALKYGHSMAGWIYTEKEAKKRLDQHERYCHYCSTHRNNQT